ncbi:lipopolysaccharide kinase InaA family protein [Carboxylicivirga marina]|uniref:lipopolysaccharide kinase InaA family protein n=1 Tax=Carboxylicivirga marina TaxID=2800988 RepID=UPI0025944BE3|nr:lipopolysaccharide kinase InaA family protein [uncultured Carboxylicivirga sp.]
MIKILINKKHEELRAVIEQIDNNFLNNGEWIKDARNQIKRIEYDGVDYCIKKFYKATAFNHLMYSYIRKSKAQRSYEIAQQLLVKNINTPEPIAFMEIYNRWHFLKHSYYICRFEHVDYTLSEVLNSEVDDKALIVRGFVNFMINGLHPQGIWHKDFNGSNVLIKQLGERHFQYSLVDLNRIKFSKVIQYHRGLHNLQQISSNPIYLAELAKYYANFKNTNEEETIYELLFVKYIGRLRRRYTKRFLHALKTIL